MSFRQVQGRRTLQRGYGRVADISSGGVLFYTAEPPPVGSMVELSVRWPYCTEAGWPLLLVITGRVVRSHNGRVAVKMVRHEFQPAEEPPQKSPAKLFGALRQFGEVV
jgi:hypothetical protein